jgi:hypothetical protein
MPASTMKKLTPVLMVDAIEPCLSFWVDRLGFEKTVEIPEGDRLGFVILAKNGIELMYQSWDSVVHDVPGVAASPRGWSTALFLEVGDVEIIAQALQGLEIVVPRRTTFYGMDEIGVREPSGAVVIFAQQK